MLFKHYTTTRKQSLATQHNFELQPSLSSELYPCCYSKMYQVPLKRPWYAAALIKCSLFSLYAVVMFLTVIVNMELANNWISRYWIIAASGNTGLGSFKPSVTFLPTDGHIIFCMFLLKGPLFNIWFWFINSELMANSHASRKRIYHMCFLWKTRHSLHVLRNTWQHCRLCLGVILNSGFITKKLKNEKTGHQIDDKRDTWLQRERQDKKALSYATSAGSVLSIWLKFLLALHMSANDCENDSLTDFEAMNAF